MKRGTDPNDQVTRVIYEALERLGSKADPKKVGREVQRLQLGLPAEDEFQLLLSWLGKCELVHQIDGLQQPPASRKKYVVPDLIAAFPYKGSRLTFLIEVKTTSKRKLSWRPDYVAKLRRYSRLVGLPVLVACKWRMSGLWTLCELKRFSKRNGNYKLSWESALKANLLSQLAGDFSVTFQPGVGIHLKFGVLERRPSKQSNEDQVHLRVDEIDFRDGRGRTLKNVGYGLWLLFLASHHDEKTSDEGKYIDTNFVTNPRFMTFAQQVLPLAAAGPFSEEPNSWRSYLQKPSLSVRGSALRKTAE